MIPEIRSQKHGKVELREEGDTPKIVGVAAVYFRADDSGTEYNLWENAVERIMPGAFTRAAVEDDVYCCFNHDPSLILGRRSAGTLKLDARADGLHYEVTPSESRLYQDLIVSLRRGDINQSSFAFVPTDVTWRFKDELQIREINEVQLVDVSPVTLAAYSSTSAGVRRENLMAECRSAFEKCDLQRQLQERKRASQWRAIQLALIGG